MKTVNVDCFAYRDDKGRYCDVLTELICKKGNCGFYKTHPEFLKGSHKANKYNLERGIVQRNQ